MTTSRRQLAAGEHVVADRELEVGQRADALVEALVAAAHEHQALAVGEVLDERAGRACGPAGSCRTTTAGLLGAAQVARPPRRTARAS